MAVIPATLEKSEKHAAMSAITEPGNFGEVLAGKVYRCKFPEEANYRFIVDMGIKTVLTLVPDSHPQYEQFLRDNDIKQIMVPLPPNKDQININMKDMLSALCVALDEENYPLLVHCNRGKHRTGCAIACFQKVYGMSEEEVVETYQRHAQGKGRAFDLEFIKSFPEEICELLRARFISEDLSDGVHHLLSDKYPRLVPTSPPVTAVRDC